jgi:hypothetical protein
MMDERLTDLERQFCEVNDLRVQHFAELMKTQAENARLRAQLEAVRNECERGWVRAANADASRRVIDVDRILAAFSNEGGDDE